MKPKDYLKATAIFCLAPKAVVSGLRLQEKRAKLMAAREAERKDRLRNPSKYLGKE